MAKPRFWRLNMKGSLSLDEAQAAVAESDGTLLRVRTGKDSTGIYFSSTVAKGPGKKGAKNLQAASLKEVTLAEVTRIG